jgi:hypothetical protein
MAAVMAWTVGLAAQGQGQPNTAQARDTTTTVSYIGCVESTGPNAYALTVSELPAARPDATISGNARVGDTQVGVSGQARVGTTGTATVGQRLQLIGSGRTNVATHAGHKVEVTGTMVPQGAAQGRPTGQAAAEMRLNVTNVRMISAMCDAATTSTPQTRPRSQAPDSTTQPGATPGAAGTTGTTTPAPEADQPSVPAEPAPEQPQRQP